MAKKVKMFKDFPNEIYLVRDTGEHFFLQYETLEEAAQEAKSFNSEVAVYELTGQGETKITTDVEFV